MATVTAADITTQILDANNDHAVLQAMIAGVLSCINDKPDASRLQILCATLRSLADNLVEMRRLDSVARLGEAELNAKEAALDRVLVLQSRAADLLESHAAKRSEAVPDLAPGQPNTEKSEPLTATDKSRAIATNASLKLASRLYSEAAEAADKLTNEEVAALREHPDLLRGLMGTKPKKESSDDKQPRL